MKKKRILALFLTAVSCLSLAVSASAAGTTTRKATDFKDYDRSAWYAEAVSAAVDNGLLYDISTKMDGSSHSIGIDENGFHVTGHNYEYKDDGSSSFYKLVKAREYQAKMEDYMKAQGLKTLTIQGELCAPGIQQNRLRLAKPEWYVFTIRENGKRVGLKRMLQICEALDITPVPIEEVDTDLPSKYPTVEALLARADGEYPNGGKKEGIVIRPTEPVFCPLISASLSMKVVSNKYLLKNDG